MEEKLLILINKVYIDLLEKANCNKSILRSIKLINKIIKESHIKDSYVLIRSTYEELIGELATTANHQFQIEVKTKPEIIRKAVIDNIDTLFRDSTIDEKMIRKFYNYLSNISHESTTRRLLRDLADNKKTKVVMKDNTYFVVATVAYIYLNYLYKNREEIELIDKLYIVGTSLLMKSLYEFAINSTPEEIAKYNGYFITEKDINFMNRKKDEMIEIKDDIAANPINEDEVKEYFVNFEELIDKYNYRELFNKLMIK